MIAYYSLTNNTKKIADILQKKLKEPVFTIETVTPYPTDYAHNEPIVQKQIDQNQTPELKPIQIAFKEGDTIFLGSPIWYDDLALPVKGFLKQV